VPDGGTKRRTPKADHTRQALLDAALELFAEKGYSATSVPDIVQRAGVGHGTFYEYFRSRRDILLAITAPVNDLTARRPHLQSQSLRDRIRSEITWYLSDHVEHLALTKVWHTAVQVDAEIAEARRHERRTRVERVRRSIEAARLGDGIDVEVAAAALMAMLEEFARRWFVEGDGPGTSAADIAIASDTVSTMWLRMLGLDDRATSGAR
jgi:AcrR family transcriptional regulator